MCSLNVRFSQSAERRGVFQYALDVEVIDSVGIPKKIFVYHQSAPGIKGNSFAEFDHIATPVDFQEIPEDAASEIVPWYRTDKCTVWLRSASDLELAKQMFVDDINALQRTFDNLNSSDSFRKQTTVSFSSGTVEPIDENKGSSIGKKVAKLAAFVCLSLGMMDASGYGFSGQRFGDIDLDQNPIIVTNVNFDGIVTTNSLSDYATRAELDEGWWSEWVLSPTYYDDKPIELRFSQEGWYICIAETGSILSFYKGEENSSFLSWDQTDSVFPEFTATRHRVAAPVPTKPEDIGAASTNDLTGIRAQLNAATETNALQTAALEGMPQVITNIVNDLSSPPGNYLAVSNAAMNALSRAEAKAGFTEWKLSGLPNGATDVMGPMWEESAPGWEVSFVLGEYVYDGVVESTIDATSISVECADDGDTMPHITVTATRTRLPTMADIAAATNGIPRVTESALHSGWAENADFAGESGGLLGADYRDADSIISQLDAATATNAQQSAALASKASTNDVVLTPVYGGNGQRFGEWVIEPPIQDAVISWARNEWELNLPHLSYTVPIGGDESSVSIEFEFDTYPFTATRTENPVVGYTLGSQTNKVLSSTNAVAAVRAVADAATATNAQQSAAIAASAMASTNYTDSAIASATNNLPTVFLPLAGGNMSGNINMGEWKLSFFHMYLYYTSPDSVSFHNIVYDTYAIVDLRKSGTLAYFSDIDSATNTLNVSLSSRVSQSSRDSTNYTDSVIASADTSYRRFVTLTNVNQSVQFVTLSASDTTLSIELPATGETKDWIVYVLAATNTVLSLPPATWYMADTANTNAIPAGMTAFYFSQMATGIYMLGRQELEPVTITRQ